MNTKPCNYTDLQRLLDRFQITPDDIAEHVGLSVEQVILAISPYYCARCPLIFVLKTYCAAETLLRRQGWKGKNCQLWQQLFVRQVPSNKNT